MVIAMTALFMVNAGDRIDFQIKGKHLLYILFHGILKNLHFNTNLGKYAIIEQEGYGMNIYKTIDRARNAGVHVNTVRLYEKCCFIPKPERKV